MYVKEISRKVLKYAELTVGLQLKRNWKIIIIIGLTGTISRIFRKYLNKIAGEHDIEEVCTAAILGTAHILGKLLM